MRGPRRTALSGIAAALLAGCGSDPVPPRAAFEVTRVFPPLGAPVTDGPELLYLNQEVSIRFSEEVDPLSVTEDTIQIIDTTDPERRRVVGKLRVQSHTVVFEPLPPLEPSLDDGSFRPGRTYRLEVVGFPRPASIRSAAGRVLDRTVVRDFRAVTADHAPSPLLHTPSGLGFVLEKQMLKAASTSRSIGLYFHEPPVPTTLTPDAFRIHRVVSEGRDLDFQEFAPKSVRLHHLPPSPQGLPEWMVELDVGELPGFALFVEFTADPEVALRNYRGELPRLVDWSGDEPVFAELMGQKVGVEIYDGERVPLVEIDFGDGVAFEPTGNPAVGFEVWHGKAVPRVRVEAGSGRDGVFAPVVDTELVPGQPFDLGNGVRHTVSGQAFEFLEVNIPDGVTVTVKSPNGEPVQIRAAGSMRIDGALQLDGTPRATDLTESVIAAPNEVPLFGGVLLAAGGTLAVAGKVTHRPRRGEEAGVRPPLILMSGEEVRLYGARLPAGTTLMVNSWLSPRGDSGGLSVLAMQPMTRGLQRSVSLPAEAFTPWYGFPVTRHRHVDVEVEGLTGGLQLEIEVAPPDGIVPSRPSREVRRALVELPLAAPLSIPPGGFVRVLLRGRVVEGVDPPSVESVRLIGV